jgi:hypothetical protein
VGVATLILTSKPPVLSSNERPRASASTRGQRALVLFFAARTLLACGTIEITPVFQLGDGGSSGTGGDDAGAGAAGAAGAIDSDAGQSCPPGQPPFGSTCEAPGGTRCTYASSQCLCFANRWECTSCPDALPSNDCNTFGGQCRYGETECTCFAGMWECGVCPSSPPTQAASCTDGALRCIYGDTNCACFNGRWSCFGGGQCPTEQPIVGSACSGSMLTQCRYGATRCACWGGQWLCL